MNPPSKNPILSTLILLMLCFSCKNDTKSNSELEEASTNNIETSADTIALASGDDLCFMSKTTAANDSEQFNYQLKKFSISDAENVEGWFITDFYGKDGSKGHFTGKIDNSKGIITGKETYMVEGEIFTEDRSYKINANELTLNYNNPDGTTATLKKVDCDDFNASYASYKKAILTNNLNTTDRSRLLKLDGLKDFGFEADELNSFRFIEVPVDLDHNYETQEYLTYIMDPTNCGSGGCTLLVNNAKGQILSSISVVKLPIYIANDMVSPEAGDWKKLYVWSDGSYRELSHGGSKYESNASVAPKFEAEALETHPEKYRVLMDYLD